VNLLDLAILIIVILIAVRGFYRGIIQEAATLVGIIASFFLAFYYYNELARFLFRFVQNYLVTLYFFSFLLLLGLSFFLFRALGLLLKKMVHLALFGWADRVLGGFFGLIKGVVVVFFLITLLTLLLPKQHWLINQSRLFPWVISLTDQITLLIPGKIKEDFARKKKELREYWEEKQESIKKKQRYFNYDGSHQATRRS
jgi:membrane protein required for colicin V production